MKQSGKYRLGTVGVDYSAVDIPNQSSRIRVHVEHRPHQRGTSPFIFYADKEVTEWLKTT